MTSPRIIFKLSTRSRPDKARRALDNIIGLVEDPNYKILVTVDLDDHTMHDFKYLHEKVIFFWGHSNNKIHAFNRSISFAKEWDILVSMSDDMVFYKKGFDNDIREAFLKLDVEPPTETSLGHNIVYYNFDQFIHYNDGFQGRNCCTMSIMGRDYYERDGWVYHPKFKNLWSDKFATDLAIKRGCYKYMGDDNIIFKHHHPAWGLAEMDAQYQSQNNYNASEADRYIYEQLKLEYGL